jgi:type I restriction enzyme M protein
MRNANFAWLQHILHHLTPNGMAGVVLANGSMTTVLSGEGEIRKQLVESGLVDCLVALPSQLFYSTQIPACLWFLARDKKNGRFRDRAHETLFIDARRLGFMEDRTQRALDDANVRKIVDTYHAWREKGGRYANQVGFCQAAAIEEIRQNDYMLSPGRYVQPEVESPDSTSKARIGVLATEVLALMDEQQRLDDEIRAHMKALGLVD